jgi:hypothetical protein
VQVHHDLADADSGELLETTCSFSLLASGGSV